MSVLNSKLYKVLCEDKSITEVIESSKNIKALFKNVSDRLNIDIDQLDESNKKCNYNYCVLNNVGCGDFLEESFELIKPKTKKQGYHAKINKGYEDPDKISYKLYLYAAIELNRKLKGDEELNKKIGAFKVAKRINSYSFCLKSNIEGKEIEFGGDWIINWNFISEISEKKQFEIAEVAHSVLGHVFWPCNKKNGRQTVNQARAANKKSIKATLDKLKDCYNNDSFEENTDYMVQDSLDKAFIDYADWYRVFGKGEAGYNRYIEFFTLEKFTKEELDSDNIKRIFEERAKELRNSLNTK